MIRGRHRWGQLNTMFRILNASHIGRTTVMWSGTIPGLTDGRRNHPALGRMSCLISCGTVLCLFLGYLLTRFPRPLCKRCLCLECIRVAIQLGPPQCLKVSAAVLQGQCKVVAASKQPWRDMSVTVQAKRHV